MSLSNMRNNPRQELKETAIGVGVISLFVLCASLLAEFVYLPTLPEGDYALVLAGTFGIFSAVGLAFLPIFVHFIGEEICDYFDI